MMNIKKAIIPLTVIVLTSFSCGSKNKNPHQYVVDNKIIESIENIQNVYNHDLYYMDYVADYKLDELLEDDLGGSVAGLLYFVNHKLLNGKLFDFSFNESAFGCSCFAIKNDNDHYIYGRNFDNKANLSPFVVKTSPTNGHKSLNVIDIDFVKLTKGCIDDNQTDISLLAAAPYLVMDGINEKGLAISILVVPAPVASQEDESKKSMLTNVALRYVLDHCQNVEEVKTTLSQFNMRVPFSSNYHFLISDASGKSAVLEYIKESETSEVANKMNFIDDANYVTNFYLSDGMEKAGSGLDRYQVIGNTLNFKKNILTNQEALNLLSIVGRSGDPLKESCTLWSSLYDLNDKTLTLAPRLDFTKTFTFKF